MSIQNMDVKRILHAAWFTPLMRGWGLPIAFVASPGTSKTSQIRHVAQASGLACEILSPGERGEGAFGVVAVPENKILTYPPPEWAMQFNEDGRGVVFIDELTAAPPALQPPLLGLFLEKRIGGHALPGGVRCIAAYNAVDEAAAGYELPPPLANRMGHINFDPGTAEVWIDWLLGKAVGDETESVLDPQAEEKRVMAVWADQYAVAKGKVAGFIRARPELLHKMPPAHDPAASKAWPSRRTWEFATRAIAAAYIHDLSEDDEATLISSFVGDAVTGEFITYLNDNDLPDPIALLDGKEQFSHNKKRPDRTYAVLAACTALVVPTDAKKRDPRSKKLWVMLTDIANKSGQDVVFDAARRMAQSGLLKHKESRPLLTKLSAVMQAAGIKGS